MPIGMQTDGPLEVQGIAKLLRRAVRTLLENARRFSSRRAITLSLSKQDGMALIRVEDHGPGSWAQRERIFEKFLIACPGPASAPAAWAGIVAGAFDRRAPWRRTVHCEARQDGRSGARLCDLLPLSRAGLEKPRRFLTAGLLFNGGCWRGGLWRHSPGHGWQAGRSA